MRLTATQRRAVVAGSTQWRGAREAGVLGNTMVALADRGLADVRWKDRPYRRMTYRLTPAGVELRERLMPIEKCSENELIERYVNGSIDIEEYGAERARRGAVVDALR